ncbi:MAG: aminopeptidase P family N-terminal domain-containing protein, partial [Bacilli bacterium]|nr:aminopeptidase P family N-terminal domain-containing protein [Bacilli bacterium]
MQNLFDSRIEKLQAQMRKDGLKAYVIPATDPHMSEECTAYFARERFYFCPFKGSDGTLLVTLDGYFIYTDGRFWTEAEGDIKGSSCILMYQGKEGVLSIPQYVKQNNLYPLGLDKKLLSRQELAAYFADDTHEIRQASYRHMVDDL